MEKKSIWIIILSILLVLVCIFAYLEFRRIVELKSLNMQLETDKTNLINDNKDLNLDLEMLNAKVAKIYRTCMTNNACKGRYPGISWYCNNVGDAVDDASHICICDVSCNLNATEI